MNIFIDVTDKRNLFVQKKLQENNYNTITLCEENFKNISENDILIYAPNKKFSTSELCSYCNNITIISGNIPDEYKNILSQKNIKHFNLLDDEMFAYKNANLTSEGVLAIIIEQSARSLYENNVLILGNGRCAKSLAIYLNKLGVNFTLCAFNKNNLPQCYLYTKKCFCGYEFLDEIDKYDIIVNTIPHQIFNNEKTKLIPNNTLYLEIASCPSVDENNTSHFSYIKLPALPSRFCSESASKICYEVIKNILNQIQNNR